VVGAFEETGMSDETTYSDDLKAQLEMRNAELIAVVRKERDEAQALINDWAMAGIRGTVADLQAKLAAAEARAERLALALRDIHARLPRPVPNGTRGILDAALEPTPEARRCHDCGSAACVGFVHAAGGRVDYCADHDPANAPEPTPEERALYAEGWGASGRPMRLLLEAGRTYYADAKTGEIRDDAGQVLASPDPRDAVEQCATCHSLLPVGVPRTGDMPIRWVPGPVRDGKATRQCMACHTVESRDAEIARLRAELDAARHDESQAWDAHAEQRTGRAHAEAEANALRERVAALEAFIGQQDVRDSETGEIIGKRRAPGGTAALDARIAKERAAERAAVLAEAKAQIEALKSKLAHHHEDAGRLVDRYDVLSAIDAAGGGK